MMEAGPSLLRCLSICFHPRHLFKPKIVLYQQGMFSGFVLYHPELAHTAAEGRSLALDFCNGFVMPLFSKKKKRGRDTYLRSSDTTFWFL